MKIGTAYYPDYFPPAEWARDLDRMKGAGIDCIRILEFAWSWYQPEPDRWSWQGLDDFLELAWQRQLKVCLSTPTATPPPWFFEKYPDARLMNDQGGVCWAHRHMTCWNHPGAWEEASRTIRALAEHCGNHPAIWGWQIDNEPNYAEDPGAFYDFNPHALRDAQRWLQDKYGSLDALNDAWFGAFWSQKYNRWEQVWRTHHPKSNPGAFLAFLQWREANMGEFVQKQAALLREVTQSQRIGVNIPETGLPFSLQIGQDYWAQARGLDWVGTDLYTASGDRENDLRALRYSCDLIRSAQEAVAPGGEFLIAETQAGPHLRTWKCTFAGEVWEPDFIRDSLRIYAERGATQTWVFMWRPTPAGREIGMNGLQTFEGDDSARTEEIRRLTAHGDHFDGLAREYRKRPMALLHYSQDSLRFLHYFETPDRPSESFDSGIRMSQVLRGAHRWLDEKGYQIRFVTDAELAAGLPEADSLMLPLSPLLDSSLQQAVVDWFEAKPNRKLWLGPDTGLLDRHGRWLPRDQRRLWTWLNVDPGMLMDVKEEIEIEGVKHARFRVFENATEAEVLAYGNWRARSVPVLVQPRDGAILHAYDWTAPSGVARGSQAVPTA
jgi:Beta-galactosidase